MRRLKLLLIAPGCDRAAVGEGGISFQLVSRIGLRHDVTVLVSRHSTRLPIAPQLPDMEVIEWPDPPLFERWQQFNSMLKPGYVTFYSRARKWLQQYLRSGRNFDLAHQIMPLALRYPSPATGLGLPLLIGPVGGSVDTPKSFSSDANKVPWYTQLRRFDEWRLRYDPLLRRTYAKADCVIAVAPYVKEILGNIPSHEVEIMTETGVASLPAVRDASTEKGHPWKFLFVGRVIRSKGVRDAIRAFAQLRDWSEWTFEIVGDGADLAQCKEEARNLGVSERVIFHGRLPRNEVDAFYERADVFLFPSFREPSGAVVVEAMSYGLAMIVADRGGPASVVDDHCGLRVPVKDPEQFARDIAAAIRELATQPARILAMGSAAREKIRRDFLWDAKVDHLEKIYCRVLNEKM